MVKYKIKKVKKKKKIKIRELYILIRNYSFLLFCRINIFKFWIEDIFSLFLKIFNL